MKSALVLGFALAASAQVDNELATSYNPTGANLVRDAAWGRSNPSGIRHPVDYNTQYLNKYGKTHDDAADDELVGYNPSGANLVRDAAWGRSNPSGVRHPVDYNTQYLNKYGKTHDDAADDELIIAPTDEFGNIKKYPRNVRFDEVADDELVGYNPSGANLVRDAAWGRSNPAGTRVPTDYNTQYLNKYGKTHDDADDEMMVYYTKDSRGVNHYQGGYTRDDAADDELVSTFYSPSGADLVKYAKQSQQTVYRPAPAHVVSRDDAADDEFATTFYSPSGADLVKYAKQSQQTVYRPAPAHVVSRDDAADDEFATTFYSPSGADLVKYAKQSQQTVYRPAPAHVVRDDEADDEMMVYYTKDSRGVNHYQGGYTRDDAADDELVSLPYSPSGADLVKYAKQSQQTVYRPTAHVVRDDADDELVTLPYHPSGADLVKYAKQAQQTVYRPTAHVVRDDADDELAYLGHLIKETQPEKVEKKPEIKRKFRHAEKN